MMQSAIGRQQQLRKLGVDTAPQWLVQGKSAAAALLLIGIALIGATAPAKASGTMVGSLKKCQTESDAVKAGVTIATRCPLAISVLPAANSGVASSESAKSVISDNSKAYIAYPNFFAIRNQAKAVLAVVSK